MISTEIDPTHLKSFKLKWHLKVIYANGLAPERGCSQVVLFWDVGFQQ